MLYMHRAVYVFVFFLTLPCAFYCENKREALVSEARSHIGKPYRYGAEGPESFDCSGFVAFTVRKVSPIKLPHTSHGILSRVKVIDIKDALAGDLLFFSDSSSGRMTHVGIFLGGDKFISAVSRGKKTGILITSLEDGYWKRTYRCAGSLWREVMDEKEILNLLEEISKSFEEEKRGHGGKR